jgi:Iml2/Tetratricopeptide repeat protein 39
MRKKTFSISKIPILVFIFTLSLLAFHQNTLAQVKFQKQIKSGLDYLYNFNIDKAAEVFESIRSKNPVHPAGYHYQSIINLWYFLDQKRESDKTAFLDLSDSVVAKSEAILDKDDKNPFIYFLLGTTFSYRAMIYARDEEYLNVLWSTKESYKYLTKVLELDSTYFDAYLGLGLYNFAVSQTPPAWKWALELTDITGDKKLGVEYLKLAADKGNLAVIEAKFYLSQVLSEFLSDYNSSEKYLTSLINNYPNNILFKYGMALLQIKETKISNAEKYLRAILKSKDTSFVQIKNFTNYQLGNIYFIKNDFDSAKTFYQLFLNNTIDEHFKGYAALRLAYCFEFLDLPDSASVYFEQTDEGNEDIDEDVFAYAMGKKFIEVPPDGSDLKSIIIQNLIEAGSYKNAIDSSLELIRKDFNDSLRAQIYLELSDAYFKIKKYPLSLDYAISVINNDNSEKWMKAYACFYAARASKEMKKTVDAELFINYANNYKDFYFENRLRNSLHALLYSLHK